MVTLFTPTYNRAHLLDRLYESILRQTDKSFEWLIVDDGSVDNTREKIDKWIEENKIDINYIYQENAGKAAAYNNGVSNAKGEVFCCIDSDDYLTDDAVESIEKYLPDIQCDNISGMFMLKQDLDGNILGDRLPDGTEYSNAFELSDKYGLHGEWSQIYKVSVLRDHPYPVIKGEKFVTDTVLFDDLSSGYKALLINKVINICEYQDEGLTSNIYKCLIENPIGYKIYYKQRIDLTESWKNRLLYIVKYNAFRSMSHDREYDYNGKYRLLAKALAFTGIIGKCYYLRNYKKD